VRLPTNCLWAIAIAIAIAIAGERSSRSGREVEVTFG